VVAHGQNGQRHPYQQVQLGWGEAVDGHALLTLAGLKILGPGSG